MASTARRIQTAKADFLDGSLYEEETSAQPSPLSRGALLGGLSRAFDLAEGRRPGHAQRVAYMGMALARELKMRPARIDDVYFGCILHDAGMALAHSAPGRASQNGRGAPVDLLSVHTREGARLARKLGLNDAVSRAIAWHHAAPSEGAEASGGDRGGLVARVVATADRVESLIDGEASPLWLRRRAPMLVRAMTGKELDPQLADTMARIMERDEFWLGLYDNDLASELLGLSIGGDVQSEDLLDLLAVISDMVDERACREPGRGREIAELARTIGESCDIAPRRLHLLEIAALLQDLGTLGVPAHFLSKPDILTVDEMTAVQQHPTLARDIVSEIPGLGAAAWWIGCHHERIDGKGYPGMLEGEDVPIEAQIIGLAEAYVALRSTRPYRPAMGRSDALSVLAGMSGTRFIPELLAALEAATK